MKKRTKRRTIEAVLGSCVRKRPPGTRVILGPTSVGKTTTTIVAVKHLRMSHLNRIALEKPEEYQQ